MDRTTSGYMSALGEFVAGESKGGLTMQSQLEPRRPASTTVMPHSVTSRMGSEAGMFAFSYDSARLQWVGSDWVLGRNGL